jgi:S-adenosylmethionine decarboxylase
MIPFLLERRQACLPLKEGQPPWIGMMQFEGPEKKLEIILKRARPELRGNAHGLWNQVVEAAYTHIISSSTNEWFDAYLLSESSLFVYADRIIIITCGKSQLFRTVPVLFQFFAPSDIKYLFYERKNFIYPEAQLSNFEAETARIRDIFPGDKFIFGPEEADHVYVYFSHTLNTVPARVQKKRDVTLEILMHGIANEVSSQFYFDADTECMDVRARSGIVRMFPRRSVIYDEHFFYPCGYSVNALMGQHYFTIHVTPQPECSYVSFETNAVLQDYRPLVQRVVKCFRPQRFTLVVTYNQKALQVPFIVPQQFTEISHQQMEMGDGYQVSFANFQKNNIPLLM